MDAGEAREVVTAWKVFRTVHEMLDDRVSPTMLLRLRATSIELLTSSLQGYNVGEEYKTISFPTFKEQYAANGMPE
jgi:hypothetical protein